jgi:hypothetical protein
LDVGVDGVGDGVAEFGVVLPDVDGVGAADGAGVASGSELSSCSTDKDDEIASRNESTVDCFVS